MQNARAKTKKRNAIRVDDEKRARVVIEHVAPEIDNGRFAIKRVIGESVIVDLDAFTDGHDLIACLLLYRHETEQRWNEIPMQPLGNDRWRAQFPVSELGRYRYSAMAWVDPFDTWAHDLARRPDTDSDLPIVLRIGAELFETAAQRARGIEARRLHAGAEALLSDAPLVEKRRVVEDEENTSLIRRYSERRFATVYDRELVVVVDRELARSSAWYEFFPRSCKGKTHGRFADCEKMLAYVAAMGFDIVYLPPVHPVGRTFRKGPNNTLTVNPGDVGSPWAIGGPEGGHKAVHPELGTLADFRRFVAKAAEHNLEVALDIAFQCSPDHPYIKEHPEWFRHRPDGTIQYAENPPKKYQDIYPFDFESEAWAALWQELESVMRFWIEQGVRIFRVDNPHTKAFAFWEQAISQIKRDFPDTIFLAEAFTRPKVMHRLAKLGFTQSYTYFTWRNTKWELTEYFTELCKTEGREYFRPNVWPNTPDILNEYLQFGGRPAFMVRLVLAATLAANYGIYGPAFELMEATPRDPGTEEYAASEKYELRSWDLSRPDSLHSLITRLNHIRRENIALHSDWNLNFHTTDNDQIICYSKTTEDFTEILLMVVNLDPHHRQSGWIDLPLEMLGIPIDQPYQVHDLLTDARYLWHGAHNFVELDPQSMPAHIFRLRRRVQREQDFDYYL